MKQILDLLLDGDRDQAQIAQGIHMSAPSKVLAYMAYLVSKNKVHCCGWREPKANGHRWPVYRFGKGKNVRQPRPKTPAEWKYDARRRQGMPIRKLNYSPRPVASPFAALGL
jgi:hypothetical protein